MGKSKTFESPLICFQDPFCKTYGKVTGYYRTETEVDGSQQLRMQMELDVNEDLRNGLTHYSSWYLESGWRSDETEFVSCWLIAKRN